MQEYAIYAAKNLIKFFLQMPANESSVKENAVGVEEDLCDDKGDDNIAGEELMKEDRDFLLAREQGKEIKNCEDPNHAAVLEVL